MKQAFESVCRRFLIRHKIPKKLGEYLISLDAEGDVFVKCTKNLNILERGIEALRNEWYRFKAKKRSWSRRPFITPLLGSSTRHTTHCTEELP